MTTISNHSFVLGYGTLSLTYSQSPKPLDEAVSLMSYVKHKYGVNVFNHALFYQQDDEHNNIELARRFCEKENDKDIVICVKGCMNNFQANGSKAQVDSDIQKLVEAFKDLKLKPKIVFQPARVDPNIAIEDTISYIYEHVKNGNIYGVGLSEVNAHTIKRAAKIAPISFIEIEVSLFYQDAFHNDIMKKASELQIPILAYSPLARGFLTDYAVTKPDFLDSINDYRKNLDWFQPEHFEHNKKIIGQLFELAHSKGMKLEQLALSYLASLSGVEGFMDIPRFTQIIPIPSGASHARLDDNFGGYTKFSKKELEEIQSLANQYKVSGGRYNASFEKYLNG